MRTTNAIAVSIQIRITNALGGIAARASANDSNSVTTKTCNTTDSTRSGNTSSRVTALRVSASCVIICRRHGVVAAAAPRVAAGYAANGHATSPEKTVVSECLYRVLGAGRLESAVRPQPRGDCVTVDADELDHWPCKQLTNGPRHHSFACAANRWMAASIESRPFERVGLRCCASPNACTNSVDDARISEGFLPL